jgi:hypothetical protein
LSNANIQLRVEAVAFLDALGTQGIWARSEPEEYVKSWQQLLTDWRDYKQKAYPDDSNIDITFNAFSDTIVITTSLKKHDDKKQ